MLKIHMEDKRMKAVIENKAAVAIHGLRPGAQTQIEVDDAGVPLDKHWRRRIADSELDGAIKFVPAEKPKVKKPTAEEVE